MGLDADFRYFVIHIGNKAPFPIFNLFFKCGFFFIYFHLFHFMALALLIPFMGSQPFTQPAVAEQLVGQEGGHVLQGHTADRFAAQAQRQVLERRLPAPVGQVNPPHAAQF